MGLPGAEGVVEVGPSQCRLIKPEITQRITRSLTAMPAKCLCLYLSPVCVCVCLIRPLTATHHPITLLALGGIQIKNYRPSPGRESPALPLYFIFTIFRHFWCRPEAGFYFSACQLPYSSPDLGPCTEKNIPQVGINLTGKKTRYIFNRCTMSKTYVSHGQPKNKWF